MERFYLPWPMSIARQTGNLLFYRQIFKHLKNLLLTGRSPFSRDSAWLRCKQFFDKSDDPALKVPEKVSRQILSVLRFCNSFCLVMGRILVGITLLLLNCYMASISLPKKGHVHHPIYFLARCMSPSGYGSKEATPTQNPFLRRSDPPFLSQTLTRTHEARCEKRLQGMAA